MTFDYAAFARPAVRALPTYNAGLSSEMVRVRYGVQHIARLASNENPWGASPAVAQALAAASTRTGDYPDAHASALRQQLAQDLGVDAQQLCFGNGSEDLIKCLCEVFLSPGDTVLTQKPTFGLHQIYPEMMGAQVQLLDLTADLQMDVQAWCEALARAPKLAFLPNPSNPVGCMFDDAAMQRMVAATSEQTLLVVDEAYVEYARCTPGYPDTLAMLQQRRGPWMVLRTFSKAWGLAGLRVGYGIAGDAALAAWVDKVRTPFNVNSMAQAAALAAWQDPAHMQQCVRKTVELREALRAQLLALTAPGQVLAGVRIAPSATNFLFLDLGSASAAVAEALLRQGVIVKPWKEAGYTQCLRVSIGTEEDNARFVQALVQSMQTECDAD